MDVQAELSISFSHRLQGLSEAEFYGDLVYKFKKIRGMTDFSHQFRKNIMRYERIGYNLKVMRQSACLVINPITVDGYASLFNCTPLDRASDSNFLKTFREKGIILIQRGFEQTPTPSGLKERSSYARVQVLYDKFPVYGKQGR